jgi:ATP-binding protein involved in chromosome partitioning
VTAEPLEARVIAALARIRNPRLENDLLSAGMIRDLQVAPDGAVNFTFLLAPDDPATLVRQARAAVQEVEGVRRDGVKISVANPSGPAKVTHDPPAGGDAPPPQAPAGPEMLHLGRIIAISSGKGGVGKSTVSANLAVALARLGRRVGLMDADVYGPTIPRQVGVSERPPVAGGKIQPLEAYGVKLMSLGLLVERAAPALWRGPIIMKIVTQFLRDVDWGQLDYFLVDLPPGTGDAHRFFRCHRGSSICRRCLRRYHSHRRRTDDRRSAERGDRQVLGYPHLQRAVGLWRRRRTRLRRAKRLQGQGVGQGERGRLHLQGRNSALR